MNPLLPWLLAWRRLAGHRLQSMVTVLGVALGLSVAVAIMIVDHHSSERRIASSALVDLGRAVPGRAQAASRRASCGSASSASGMRRRSPLPRRGRGPASCRPSRAPPPMGSAPSSR
jgi:hypothetical protein